VEKNLPLYLQEIIFTDKALSSQIVKWEKAGLVKKIAPRIYSGKIGDAPAAL
jgi:hypothetical protein